MTGGGHPDPNWAGRIAFILTCAIAISLCAAIIIVALTPEPLDQSFGAVITTLTGAAVGAVATYLGTTREGGGGSSGGAGPAAPPRDDSEAEPPA